MSVTETEDLLHGTVRAHKTNALDDPDTYDGPGPMPPLNMYMAGCSYVNLAKLVTLEKKHPRLHELYGNCFEGRKADHVNRYVHKELAQLTERARGTDVTPLEFDRMSAMHEQNPTWPKMNICQFWLDGACRKGDQCGHIHLDR